MPTVQTGQLQSAETAIDDDFLTKATRLAEQLQSNGTEAWSVVEASCPALNSVGRNVGVAIPLPTVFQHLRRDLMIDEAAPGWAASSCRPLPSAGRTELTLGARLPRNWGRPTLQPRLRRSNIHCRAHHLVPWWNSDARHRKCWKWLLGTRLPRTWTVPAASSPHRQLRLCRWPNQHRRRHDNGGSTT
ncbi:hypothetical protein C2845_PM12G20860 [Panicum miliaceum]|uniref:Uncharacterized protein n=1 Tax=Panicum miliaceum TaxID=4540 RepID=A0A3L6QF27_PANMI|nr:hypothetical protein C2845_PM12G20860 [Panicum miliaceum]